MIIRKASPEDFEIFYDFVNELETHSFDPVIQQTIYLSNLRNPDVIYMLAQDGERPVGMITCHIQWLLHHASQIAEIQEMYVIPSYRGKGTGKMLLNQLKTELFSRGIRELEVTSSLLREDAHRFYLREGFVDSHKKFTCKL